MKAILRFFACLLTLSISQVEAYEIETHTEVLTRAAGRRSTLQTDSDLLPSLGLEKAAITDLAQRFPNSRAVSRTIAQLLEDGADFEDDISSIIPSSPRFRVTKHFYNPVTGQGLTVPLFGIQTASPEWALARPGAVNGQEYSYWSARQSLFDALTKSTEDERKVAFGKTFQTLGHVIHHLQDMGQPQHARDELHCDRWACAVIGAYAPSLYETWTNRESVRTAIGQLADPGLAGYDIASSTFSSTFNSPRRFWHTEAPGNQSAAGGKGMAEFSNRNFVTAGTNYESRSGDFQPNANFGLPDPRGSDLVREQVDITDPRTGKSLKGEMWFVPNEVRDNYLSTSDLNLRGSTYSVFDADLTRKGARLVLSLNRFNVEAAHQFLIPRAVAYSAGLINYFFRGKLDFRKDESDPTKFRIVNLGPDAMNGRFALYYDAKDGKRYPVQVDPGDPNRDSNDPNAWVLSIRAIDPSQPTANLSEAIAFVPPVEDSSPTSPKVRNEYMLVFSGDMGEEKSDSSGVGAVAAKAIKAEINGTLYVKVQRNDLSQVTLRVDKAGTRELEPGEFDPLDGFDRNSGRFNRSNWQAAWYKQVEFKMLPFGGYNYQVLSFSVPNWFAGSYSYVRGPDGNFVRRQRAISWLAKKTPFGDFEFSLDEEHFEGGNTLRYERRYTEAGKPRTEQGAISWPAFSLGEMWNRAGIVHSHPVISADGLRVSGFLDPLAPTITSGAGVTEVKRDFVEHAVRLLPGAAPSASLETGPPQPHFRSKEVQEAVPPRRFAQASREFVNCDGTRGSALQSESFNSSYARTETMTRTLEGIGSINGDTKYVEYNDALTRRVGYELTDNQYPIGCHDGLDLSIRYTGNGDAEDMSSVVTAIIAPSSRAEVIERHANHATVNNPDTAGYGHAVLPPYDVVRTGPPPWVIKPVDPGGWVELIKAFNENARDVVRNENGGLKFRDLTVDFSSIADVSPIGEIFFSTADGRTIIHEPVAGGIKKIVLPPNVMRVLGALWL